MLHIRAIVIEIAFILLLDELFHVSQISLGEHLSLNCHVYCQVIYTHIIRAPRDLTLSPIANASNFFYGLSQSVALRAV